MLLDALGWSDARQLEFAPHAATGLLPGRIVGEHRTHYQVATELGELPAEIPGRLRNSAEQRSDLPGVGDFVALRLAGDSGPAIIEAVLPRHSAMIRKAAQEHRPQLIASNIDIVFVVTALDGDFNLQRLERYLVLVADANAAAVIIINKADTCADAESSAAIAQLAISAPDVPMHLIAARAATGVSALEHYFDGNKTIALVGSSGVGKSTLTNQLLGSAVQATQEVRGHDNRGRHTTTQRQLFVRPGGGSIMDTPGMRGLELWDDTVVPEPDFDDIETLAAQCNFRNCAHASEPACAVRAAIARGELSADRLASYVAAQS